MSVKTIVFNVDETQPQSQSVTKKNKKGNSHSTHIPKKHHSKSSKSIINPIIKEDGTRGLILTGIDNKNTSSDTDEVTSSLSYLKKLTREYKPKISDSYENTIEYSTPPELSISLPNELDPNISKHNSTNTNTSPKFSITLKNTPKYGILKNSTLPTFRTWSRKNANNAITQPDISTNSSKITFGEPSTSVQSLHENTEELQKNHINNNLSGNLDIDVSGIDVGDMDKRISDVSTTKLPIQKNTDNNTKPPVKPRNTRKNLFGKHKNGKVSVLIKNSTTRKRIMTEQSVLHATKINVMKRYLIKRHLLKVGTWAPDDIIQSLYEQSILSGNIENKAKEVLLHNFFTTTNE